MEVKKCAPALVAPVVVPQLTYAQIILQEGVYAVNHNDGTYLIVISKGGEPKQTVVLYFCGGVLQPADISWNTPSYTYTKTNKKVIFDLVD